MLEEGRTIRGRGTIDGVVYEERDEEAESFKVLWINDFQQMMRPC